MTSTHKGPQYVVPYRGQGSEFGDEEIDTLRTLLLSGRHLSDGTERTAFEREFAAYLLVPYVRTVTSCTVALAFATYLCDLRPGDEVIASSLTFQSTVSALLGLDVQVKFADVEASSLCMDPKSVERLITSRTRAIFVTHYGGQLADVESILELAGRAGAIVVEDCAHALGSTRNGRPATLGHIGTWSFHSLKNISTLGQGGALSFHEDRFDSVILRIRSMEPDADFVRRAQPAIFGNCGHGALGVVDHAKNSYTHDCTSLRFPGTNAIMAEPAAAVGRVQLRKLEGFVDRRRAIAMRLNDALGRVDGIMPLGEPEGSRSSYHLYSALLDDGVNRDIIASRLEASGIEIILRYFPVHLLPEWRLRGSRYGDCPVTEDLYFHRLLNLPIYPTLTDSQVDFMVESVEKALR